MADLPSHYVTKNPNNEPVNNMDEFALHINPQQEGNINRWIEADVPLLGKMDEPLQDKEEDPEEEEMEEEEMVNDEDDGDNKEDDAEFGGNFHIGESSAMRVLLAGNSKVCALGPMCGDLKSVHKGVKRLSKQMHDMYRTERKMAGKLKQDELRMNGQEFDITALDTAVKENRSENFKIMKLIEGLSREFTELKIQNRKAEELSRWEAWVRGRIPNNLRFPEEPSIDTASVPRDDDPYVMVRDAVMVTQEDEDDDPNAP
uniref:Uncharacterized protein n=1 Tax=Tanacetum cinerariifolium TaxID=118510 RepID=A0A699HRN5_TANCI|nr:hypothetical protein [Tanacetum cinerariifolium]